MTYTYTKALAPMDGNVVSVMMRTSPECVKILDPSGELRLMNENGMTLMEIDDFDKVEGEFWWNLWPSQHKNMLIEAVSAASRGSGATFEAMCPTAMGTVKHWRVRVVAISGGPMNGKILASSQDITAEKSPALPLDGAG